MPVRSANAMRAAEPEWLGAHGASPAAVTSHYDLGNDFFALWLDPEMVYTCAMWSGAGAAPGLDVRVQSWVDYEPDAPFDAIVSVEAIEAFARRGLSREEKVRIYRSLFERVRGWLKPGGVFGLQMITYGQVGPERFDDFIAAEIFPESDLPRLSEVIEASEGLLELVSLRNDRGDYVRTLRLWLAALKAQRAAACEVVGPAAVKRFEDYLRLSWRMFASGACDLHRLVLRRTDSPRLAPPASASF